MSTFDMAKLHDLVEAIGQVTDADDMPSDRAADPARLTAAFQALREHHRFAPGDLVRWKAGLRNKKRPHDGQPVIVMEVFDEPLYDHETSSGSPYFREPLTLVVGDLDDDGDFVLWHLDGRRLEHFG